MYKRQIIDILNKIKPPYNINGLTQQNAIERLQEEDKLQQEIAAILKERDRLIEAFKTIPFVKRIYPTQANFILVGVDDVKLRYNQLVQEGFVVRKRDTEPLCENTLRYTVGTDQENTKLITILRGLS